VQELVKESSSKACGAKCWCLESRATLFAVIALIAVSILFSVYLRHAPSYHAVYGSLGAFVVLMMWLYLMGLVLYLGGEINSEIRKLSGKPVAQKQ
jgi:membrane protein